MLLLNTVGLIPYAGECDSYYVWCPVTLPGNLAYIPLQVFLHFSFLYPDSSCMLNVFCDDAREMMVAALQGSVGSGARKHSDVFLTVPHSVDFFQSPT